MQNRLQILIDRVAELRHALTQVKPRQRNPIQLALKNAVERLNTFGCKGNLIKVTVTQPSGLQFDIYYTDITLQEAVEYTRIKLKYEAKSISGHAIPLGKAIKI